MPRHQVTPVVRPVWALDALLGEGPIWLPREQALRFVDIKRGLLHRFEPLSGATETVIVGGQPSFILPVESDGFLVGSGHKVHLFDGKVMGQALARLHMPSHNRTNDGTVDPDGRVWFGTMDDEEKRPTGALYCLDRGRPLTTSWCAIVTNGPAVTSDGRCLYLVNSAERTIWRVGLSRGRCAEKGELFLQLDEKDGHPDGVVLDSEDCLWVALWDGWGVRRYAPDGKLLLHVDVPCARPTKLAFGDPDLRTAYVTTARIGLERSQLEHQPMAGSLFRFRADVPGRVLPCARLS